MVYRGETWYIERLLHRCCVLQNIALINKLSINLKIRKVVLPSRIKSDHFASKLTTKKNECATIK